MKKQILVFLVVIFCVFGCGFSTAFATSNYTNVLNDLQKDSDFHVVDYPKIENDYSLQLIQLAESSEGDLLVYIYQPCGTLQASHIRFSTTIGDELAPNDYKLQFVNKYETLFKYVVEDFKVKEDSRRYYEVISVFRPWDSAIDEDTGNDNTIDYVTFNVGKRFILDGFGEDIQFHCIDTTTIEVTDKYVDFLRYDNFPLLGMKSVDSHYIAFNTDKKIENLMEADVIFNTQKVAKTVYVVGNITYSREDVVEHEPLTIYPSKVISTTNWGFSKHEWIRITPVSDFIATENLTDTAKAALVGKTWILRFYETPYEMYTSKLSSSTHYTEVTEVSILRLKFETEGVVYNLGVVDNKQSGDLIPGNKQYPEIPWWVWVVLAVVVLLVLALIVKPIATVVVWLIKLLWYIVSAPFRLVAWIVQTARNKRQ